MTIHCLSARLFRSFFVTGCLAATLLISSCSKDEEGIPNRIIIDGTAYTLSKGYITGYGVDDDASGNLGSLYEVLLVSSGVAYDGDDLSGTGQLLYMGLFSRSTIELAAGTYTVRDSFLEGSVLESFAADGNFTTGSGSGYEITNGTLTISKSGNSWVFKFEFTATASGGSTVEITGSFSGELEEVE
ncbi:MAG: hypothetical protein NZM13_05340 [Cyclobacteriaceae bacterium]|nr:hypothetical protein [Cyclobacteriaceae bacterium]MDW8331319.1 hypothetical protein [Cyclobacteriaceae bacterium]